MARAATARKPALSVVDQAPRTYLSAAIGRFDIAPENPRKLRPQASVDALAQNIAAHGVLEPVICYADDDNGFQITVGGTRYLAAKTAGLVALPYLVLAKPEAVAAGLAEQEGHTPLHPADQAVAYAAELARLNGDGPLVREAAIETIAKRTGKTARFVAQRLALADLFPPILKALAADKISVKQAEAWANAGVDRQEELWANKDLHDADPDEIKRAIDKADLSETDRLAKFVGEAAYKAAGGAVRTDLFDVDLEPWETKRAAKGHLDRELIQKLAKAKLAEAKMKIEAEGWGEVKTTLAISHAYHTEKAQPKTKEARAKYRAEISIDSNGKLTTVRGLRIKTKEAAEKSKPTATSNWNDPAVKKIREQHDVTTDVATQIVARAFFGKVSVALVALLAALSREVFRELQLHHGGLFDLNLYLSSLTPRGLSSDVGYKAKRVELVRLLKPHKADLETYIHDGMTDDQRGMLLAFLVGELIYLNESLPDDPDVEGRRQLSTLGRLAGAEPSAHAGITNVAASVYEVVHSQLVNELVGFAPATKLSKKPAKAKK